MEDSIYGEANGISFLHLFTGDIYLIKETWHIVRIVVGGNIIKAYVDNGLVADVVDMTTRFYSAHLLLKPYPILTFTLTI